ncbi:nuclear transport factor 2 family protein [Halomonas denitrificans]|nr:nuclear transport factor 2 family protein [Halomonas denitrificans]
MTAPCTRATILVAALLLILPPAAPAAGLDDPGAQGPGPAERRDAPHRPSPGPATDEDLLRTLKTETWPRAYRTRDVALLESILAEEFVLIDANGGITDRRTELSTLPDYRWTHDHFDYRIDHLEIIDHHTAIVAGTGEAHGTRDGTPYCLSYRSSNVLVRRDESWRAVLSHVSGVDTGCEDTD